MSKNRARSAALIVGLLLAIPTDALAATAYVGHSGWMRSGPAADYRRVVQLRYGATVQTYRCANHWCLISWRGHRGYFLENHLVLPRHA